MAKETITRTNTKNTTRIDIEDFDAENGTVWVFALNNGDIVASVRASVDDITLVTRAKTDVITVHTGTYPLIVGLIGGTVQMDLPLDVATTIIDNAMSYDGTTAEAPMGAAGFFALTTDAIEGDY